MTSQTKVPPNTFWSVRITVLMSDVQANSHFGTFPVADALDTAGCGSVMVFAFPLGGDSACGCPYQDHTRD